MARAFVTGIGGFLGPRLATSLLARGFEVTGLTRRLPSEVGGLPPGARVIRGDLLDAGPWHDALTDVDVVIHAAAATGKASPGEHARVNVDGAAQLVSTARRQGVRRLVFVSSIAATFRHVERYHYAQAKQRAEALVRECELDTVIVRPTIIVGPGSPVLGGLRRLAALPVVPIFGDGTTQVQPVWVDDAAEAIAAVADDPSLDGTTVPIAGPDVLSIEDFVLAIARMIGRSRPRTLHIPLSLVLPLLAAGESIAYRAMPITVGQLATFRCDGTAGADALVRTDRPVLGVNEMLERSL